MFYAFVSGTAGVLGTSTKTCWTTLTPSRLQRRARLAARRVRVSMSTEEDTKTRMETKVENEMEGRSAPSFNTTAFSDFVDSLQGKATEMQEKIQNIDSDELIENISTSSKGLMDNFLAGDWLNRGELYGGVQLLLVFLLLRGPTLFDALIALCTGPLLIVLGALVSGKALVDLGVKNLSMWPAPVPEGTLKTEGMYELVRHPIYSGLLLASTGFSVSTGSPARLAIVVGMTLLLMKKIAVEEEFLLDVYADYGEYMEKVPYKMLPKIY